LALDHPGCTLIADDERFQISLTGTLGFLIKAKKAGLLPSIKPLLDQISETDFYISTAIIQQALRDAGE
jgi:predicted nucleic acid-binding protein